MIVPYLCFLYVTQWFVEFLYDGADFSFLLSCRPLLAVNTGLFTIGVLLKMFKRCNDFRGQQIQLCFHVRLIFIKLAVFYGDGTTQSR